MRAADASGEIAALTRRLEAVNGALWDVEDQLAQRWRAPGISARLSSRPREKSIGSMTSGRRLKNAVSAAAGCVAREVKEHPDY